jgi:hypothetical protein
VGTETSWSIESQAMALREKIGGLSDDSVKIMDCHEPNITVGGTTPVIIN